MCRKFHEFEDSHDINGWMVQVAIVCETSLNDLTCSMQVRKIVRPFAAFGMCMDGSISGHRVFPLPARRNLMIVGEVLVQSPRL